MVSYRQYRISFNPKPIPTSTHDFDFVHDDYDGAPDANDPRCGSGCDIKDCIEQIDEIESELAEDSKS